MDAPIDPRVAEADPRPPNDGDGDGGTPPVEHSSQTNAAMAEEGISEGLAVDDDDGGSDKEEEKEADDGDGSGDKANQPLVGSSAQGMTTGADSSAGGASLGDGGGSDGGVSVGGGVGGSGGAGRGDGGDGVGGDGGGEDGGSGGVGSSRGHGGGGDVGGASGRSGGGRGGVRVADWVGERAARASSQARAPVTRGSGRRRGDEPKGKSVATSEPAVTQERVISLEDYVEHSRQEDVLEQARENPGLMAVVMEEMRRIREEEAAWVRASLAEEEEARAFAQEFEEEEAAEEALAREEEERVQGRVTVVQEARRWLRERPAFDPETYAPPIHLLVPSGLEWYVSRQEIYVGETVLLDPEVHLS